MLPGVFTYLPFVSYGLAPPGIGPFLRYRGVSVTLLQEQVRTEEVCRLPLNFTTGPKNGPEGT